MDKITTVGLDLAKQVMSLHAVAADGRSDGEGWAP